jgi:CRP/FNR family transcriptional regulator
VHSGDDILLEKAEFFRALTPEQLERLEPRLVEKRILRGRVLFFEGKPAEYLWAIRRGEVRLYKSSSDGRITTLETIGPGGIFGAVSALEEGSYPASAEGVADGVAWCLPRNTFLRMLAEEPLLTVEVLRVVTHRLYDARERVRAFAHDSAPSRLAQALLRATRGGEAHVTRRALAEAAGTTVETAIRVLRGFEQPAIRSDLGQLPTAFDQLHHAPPELRRVTPPCHVVLLHDRGSGVQSSASAKAGARESHRPASGWVKSASAGSAALRSTSKSALGPEVGTKFASGFPTDVAAESGKTGCCIGERSCVETLRIAAPVNPQ